MAIIYCRRNILTGMCYVGKTTKTFENRLREHRNDKRCPRIYRALQKYGEDAFVNEILEVCSEDIVDDRERHWISTLNCVSPNGYNLKSGGSNGKPSELTRQRIAESNRGRKHTPEARENMSKAGKGRVFTDEHRRKIGEAHKGHKYNVGRKASDETRQRMSESQKGRVITDEARRKISEANSNPSAETRRKMREAQRGRKASLETRQKMSDKRRGVPKSSETRRRMSKSAKAYWRRKRENDLQLKLF